MIFVIFTASSQNNYIITKTTVPIYIPDSNLSVCFSRGPIRNVYRRTPQTVLSSTGDPPHLHR